MSEEHGPTEPETPTPADAKEPETFVTKFKAFINEFGMIAVFTWFSIFFATWAAFAALISAGLDLGGWLSDGEGSGWLYSTVKDWGPIGLAYIPTQIVKPIRAAATFAIAPIVYKLVHGKRGKSAPEDESASDD